MACANDSPDGQARVLLQLLNVHAHDFLELIQVCYIIVPDSTTRSRSHLLELVTRIYTCAVTTGQTCLKNIFRENFRRRPG